MFSDITIPTELQCFLNDETLIDHSYKNDTCPKFALYFDEMTDNSIYLFIEHEDIEQREALSNRFIITQCTDYDYSTLLDTENLSEVITFINNYKKGNK